MVVVAGQLMCTASNRRSKSSGRVGGSLEKLEVSHHVM